MSEIKDTIKARLSSLPELPGIYKMLDKNGNIIYIGKSKCLKKRVKSYFTKTPAWEKVKKMVNLIAEINYEVTDTHLEARLLECELIKYYKPFFNAQMKNDQQYVYLKVNAYNMHNPLAVIHEREGTCYGPFRSRSVLTDIVTSLKNIYPITKNESSYQLTYNLLPLTMNRQEYIDNRQVLLELFDTPGELSKLIEVIQLKMMEASSEFRFETASMYRDLLPCIRHLQKGIEGFTALMTRNIVLKLPTPKGIKLFYIKNGTMIHKKLYKAFNKNSLANFINKGNLLVDKLKTEDTPQKEWFLSVTSALPLTDKMTIDFRDILFSEILSLPEEMVIYL
ncbi:nucleotide excision repair endonuclease [Anaerocolumna cellulosilytica]|uniref:Nucleotide excision repair endonuclease n=1 Tax=Anaerocolumna cellulosilytica TaxID=433286 RepID=A0A6S6R4T5_9FIRM|nr:GIY-YIG nuclease family protein [Anaerocolumna cellulosilytica]MBB5197283.1 excinuclease ABC subunit C [Anaerocolumna cellulosilytica]BCJ94091.1 nucleotide excision repair endonuclease [Anaerocolumna cellulosilytica]